MLINSGTVKFINLEVPYFFFIIGTSLGQSTEMANVVELKVGLHCEECIKKILKAIKKMEVDTYDVDTQLNKVTVTGSVTSNEVIRVLHKIGKQATSWDDSQMI